MGILLPRLTAADSTVPADLRPADDRELCLLLACARRSPSPADAARVQGLVRAGLDWDRVLRLASRHGLRPLLHAHLSRLAAGDVPPAVLASLRDFALRNGAYGVLFTGELLRLVTALEVAGIEAMPFKGPALAQQLYGQVALRQFGDLDILVRPSDVGRAAAVLDAQGFTADVDVPAARRTAFLRQEYVQVFRRDDGRTIVELHWALSRRAFVVRFDGEAVFRRQATMTLQGRTVRVPANEDLLLMLCVHGSRHCWDKLEHLAGVAELVRSAPIDWPIVWARAEAMHCRRMVAFALLLAHALFEVPQPSGAADAWLAAPLRTLARATVVDAQADRAPALNYARLAVRYLQLKDTHADRARAVARELTLATPDEWAMVDLPGPLSIAYPLVRAVRIARRHRAAAAAAGDSA